MESNAVLIDDQPVAAGFFGEGNWLSEYITPDNPDVLTLWKKVRTDDRATNMINSWDWVANQVKYKPFVHATLRINGVSSEQDDYWEMPALCMKTHVGNCACKSFLLASLLRNELSQNEVYCVLGNLYNGKAEGHAWVEANLNGVDYILESTRNDVPMIETYKAARYEPVHYFNDKVVYAVPDRTLMIPFSACYSSWLGDYLQWAYINGGQNG